jgi:2-oxoglutarate dehydrogenase E1 component
MQDQSIPASFLTGANASFIAGLYARYLGNPDSVDASWRAFFGDLHDDAAGIRGEIEGASWTPRPEPEVVAKAVPSASAPAGEQAILDSIRALMLIRAHRVRGHLEADLDPLKLVERHSHPDLDPATYGFGEADWDRSIFVNGVLGLEQPTLREIVALLKATYCGTMGVEFMHIQNPEERAWIQEHVEALGNLAMPPEEQRAILQSLTVAEGFEKFLQIKYTGTKRFGLEGGESLIPSIEEVLKKSGQLGVREVIFGMAHRGRLNVLTNLLGKPFTAIFSEFQGNSANPEDVQGSGDVKYHLGTSNDREFGGKPIHVSLTANPSHLEAVNPVVLGKVRAKQDQTHDVDRDQVLGLLIHGDAAMAGQGLVAECLALSELKGYRTGGTMHIVINNQIGFTTMPQYSRSGPYATDVAKMIQAPIFHVNGDDPEAVVNASRLAAEFRHEFRKDVVVDIVCYRRQGHNEGDEPGFTQPIMYRAIRDQPTTRELYAKALAARGVVSEADAEAMAAAFHQRLEQDFAAATGFKPNKADWLEGRWAGMEAPSHTPDARPTGVKDSVLQTVGKALVAVPDGFDLNSKIARQLKAKEEMFKTGEGLDWATGEALAFGTLLLEGYPVRLSGQDCGRGTFSQRHAVVYDQQTEERYVALNHIEGALENFEVLDSPLSEAAVLGFEYGYSLAEPRALVLWEGQFGDFVNGAQVIIDQFIVSGEAKWLRMSGLVMLLPHGYEGQGPEHSSARPERFLQLCAEDNLQVANCTTPANYFHVLRRQLHRNYRKPLIIMTPKSLLRHKLAISPLKDFAEGTGFRLVLPEVDELESTKVRRVVLCTGKVYYDLYEERQKRGLKDVALVRIEQLYPFPAEELSAELAKYPDADVIWCQEEPQNMGAWSFMDRRIEAVLTALGHKAKRPVYVGRAEGAAPATGLLKRHNQQQAKLVDEALTVG